MLLYHILRAEHMLRPAWSQEDKCFRDRENICFVLLIFLLNPTFTLYTQNPLAPKYLSFGQSCLA